MKNQSFVIVPAFDWFLHCLYVVPPVFRVTLYMKLLCLFMISALTSKAPAFILCVLFAVQNTKACTQLELVKRWRGCLRGNKMHRSTNVWTLIIFVIYIIITCSRPSKLYFLMSACIIQFYLISVNLICLVLLHWWLRIKAKVVATHLICYKE